MSETSTSKPKPKAKAKPKAQPDNMHIWNQVCETDPDYTKEVGYRGGFTSIVPQYQKQRMTETFGPCGIGWGAEAEWEEIVRDEGTDSACTIVKCLVRVWYRDPHDGAIRYLPPVKAKATACENGREDLDSDKKCFTDAFTKSVSDIGLNADVFLGLFDDPEYLAGLMKKKQGGPATEEQVNQLKALADEKESEWLPRILQHFNVDCLEDMAKQQAQMVLDRAAEKGN